MKNNDRDDTIWIKFISFLEKNKYKVLKIMHLW